MPSDPRPIEGGGIECSGNDSSSAIGVNLAYNFTEVLGLEVGWVDLGNLDIGVATYSAGGPLISRELSIDANVVYLAGTASYSLSDRWSLTGRLGIYDPDVTLKSESLFQTFETDADIDTDLYAGVSFDYSLSENWITQIRYDDFDIGVTSIGLKYSFK